MRTTAPVLTVREWSRTTPDKAPVLRGLVLNRSDRELLQDFSRRTSLRVEELRQGLRVEVGPHVGTVNLSCLRLSILPKLSLDTLMAMVAYAFDLSDLNVMATASDYAPAEKGFVDLLGMALLQRVRRIVRRGLVSEYRQRREVLTTPRGRIDMRHAAVRPKRTDLLCEFSEFTTDHCLHQVLAAGLRLAARLVQSNGLRGDLIRTAEQFFGGHQRLSLDHKTLTQAKISLDRRCRHYEPALKLVTLLHQGSCLANHVPRGEMSLSGFLLDMNRLFEVFLIRHLQAHAPEGTEVIGQETRTDVFAYLSNPLGWREPVIRPDLVFRRHGETIAIGDAKYRDHRRRAPSTAELYQLITYGLAYSMTAFREVLLFYPLEGDSEEPSPRLLFAPGGSERVRIRLAGVPIGEILAGKCWWPSLAVVCP